MKLKKLIFFLIYFLFCSVSSQLYAQKYYFQHYDIENGLLQSQVMDITQDNHKQLWLSTIGGINCFDSKQFTAFTTEEGLLQNASYCIAADKNGKIWYGNAGRIGCFERTGLKTYPFEKKQIHSGIWRIICDQSNPIWAVRGHQLYRLDSNRMEIQQVVSDDEIVTAARADKAGNLYVSILGKGIYKFENHRWKLFLNANLLPRTTVVVDFAVNPNKAGQIYLITSNGFYVFNNGSLVTKRPEITPRQGARFTCILLDKKNDIWIGADNGAYLITNDHVVFFNEKNGFTNLRVFCIFEDNDGHIWLGTDGAGMFKYSHDNFQIYDKTQGLTNDVVMNMAETAKGEIYMSTNGGGIICYNHHKIKNVPLPVNKLMSLRVNCLFNDISGALWIGTDNSGLWKKRGADYSKIYPGKGDDTYLIFTGIIQDNAKRLWFTTNMGCYYLEGHGLVKVSGMNEYCNSAVSVGKDSILLSTRNGIRLIVNKKIDLSFLRNFPEMEVTCLQYAKPFLFVGTTSRGIIICNTLSGELQSITTKNNLGSMMVYSLQVIQNVLWAGTGRGVSKYQLETDGRHLHAAVMPLSSLASECNQNAMLRVQDRLWVGTTHGIYVYPLSADAATATAAGAIIENVQPDANVKSTAFFYNNGYKLPASMVLASAQSRLSVRFQAVAFDDQKVLFQYKLEGLDKDYSHPLVSNVVDYPGLPPGNYTFKVRALTNRGGPGSAAAFSFTVTPAFHQTLIFKILMILLLSSLIAGAFVYKIYAERQRLYYINKVKLQEQENVRRQTAEDFHDDLGNKLTRINMLSELLDKKISPALTDEKSLITQIRLSAAEMYGGTKKILWALNPNNDNLKEIINEVVIFTTAIFENTAIVLTVDAYKPEIDAIKLPLGYSHNLTLIFKELMNNILKHSEAGLVTLSIASNADNTIDFTVKDNGKGFLVNDLSAGNGMRNIKKRAAKLNGEINISSVPGSGTVVRLKISIP